MQFSPPALGTEDVHTHRHDYIRHSTTFNRKVGLIYFQHSSSVRSPWWELPRGLYLELPGGLYLVQYRVCGRPNYYWVCFQRLFRLSKQNHLLKLLARTQIKKYGFEVDAFQQIEKYKIRTNRRLRYMRVEKNVRLRSGYECCCCCCCCCSAADARCV